MHYLMPALYAEGRTDHDFFAPLLGRLCESLCAARSTGAYEIQAVQPIPKGKDNEDAIQRIVAARDAWNLLFLHADAHPHGPDDARAHCVEPVFAGVREVTAEFHGVAVVPVHEMEAWTLVDGDALRAAFSVSHDDDTLGVPSPPHLVEAVPDPKVALEAALGTTLNRRRRRRVHASRFLGRIGEEVSLDVLRRVPAFQRLEADLIDALAALRVIEP